MQFFDIVLFALIAIFFVLRLRGVLGNRDGHEGGYGDPFKRDEHRHDRTPDQAPDHMSDSAQDDYGTVIELPGQKNFEPEPSREPEKNAEADFDATLPEGPLGDGIRAIRQQDPDFHPDQFVSGAKMAFEMILNAYAEGDTATLKNLLSAEVFAGFEQAIVTRSNEGQVLQETLVGISKAEMVEATLDGREAQVTVKFVSEQISALLDAEGRVIEGDPTKVVEVTDFWTFARPIKSRDPNWTLIGTGSLA